jgi:hypothetical protein
LSSILAPENLESSKVISLLNENLSFKLDDFLNLKEVVKLTNKKDELISFLRQLSFIKIEGESAQIHLPENFVYFSIMNFPQKMTKLDVIKSLELENVKYDRIYKKSLFWCLVTDVEATVRYLENKIKSLKFEENSLKYDLVNKASLLKTITKQINNANYQKEANELKADTTSNSSKKWEKKGDSSRHNSEAFSWRKKSNDQTFGSPNSNPRSYAGEE